jgi:hypothetical protein
VLHSFQLSELSKASELHFAFHGQVADFFTEASFPPNRWAMVDDKSSGSSQFDGIAVFGQMLN